MRKNYIKFPTAFFDTKEWQKPRKYSKAEALLYLLNSEETFTVRELAYLWQWAKSSVQDFLNEVQREQMLGQNSDKIRTSFTKSKNELRKTLGQNSDKLRTNEEPYLIVDNYNPPSILSKSKDLSNIHIPPKGETHSLFSNFQKWILDNAPRVARMKEPFTEAQYLALKDEFDTTFICDLLREMHNYEPLLTKNRSANLTFRNWARRRNKWDKDNEKSKRTTNTAGNAEPDEILRAVAEGIARSRTHQEWQS